MHLIFEDVNHAFTSLVRSIHDGSIPVEVNNSRNGEVLQIMEPVILEYKNPRRRVLFNQERDCNPFFHVFEALWMLAGREDIAPLVYYAKQIANYSDDGVVSNGAYGYRWRKAEVHKMVECGPGERRDHVEVDQLNLIIDHLKNYPESRRVVLQMWNVEDDLLKIGVMGQPASKDVCCNLSVMFSIRKEKNIEALGFVKHVYSEKSYLDMTVTNRSNDLVWGCLGANYVHFSFLQEYIANCLGVQVGKYYQFSNNLHIYTKNNSGFKPEEWLNWQVKTAASPVVLPENCNKIDLVKDKTIFDREVKSFVEENGHGEYTEPFLDYVAKPMCHAFVAHKQWRDYVSARRWADRIEQNDWKWVAIEWLKKRELNWQKKGTENVE